jgi:simple sugar transport system substrate-binding protein
MASRNKFSLVILAGLMALGLAGPVSRASAADDPRARTLNMTLIVHCCLGNAFWEPLMYGAREAAKQLNVKLDIQNAELDPARMVNYINEAVANHADAILPMIVAPDAQREPLKKAMKAGIIVIANNVDDPDGDAAGDREAYVGASFFDAAVTIANRVIKEGGVGKGDRCLLPGENPEQHMLAARAGGALKALRAVGADGDVLRTGDKPEEVISLMSQYLLAHPNTKCIIGIGTAPTSVMPQAVEEAGLKPLPNGGFDTNPATLANILAGKTIATMDQLPFWQGYMAVTMAAYQARYGLTPMTIDTSNGIVDASNAKLVAQFAGTHR